MTYLVKFKPTLPPRVRFNRMVLFFIFIFLLPFIGSPLISPLIEILGRVESDPDSDFIKELRRFHLNQGGWKQDTISLIQGLRKHLYKL